MKIFVDIDQTICFYEGKTQTYAKPGSIDYSTASPYKDRIEKINNLYDQGNVVVYWTSRGSRTGKNWFNLTLNQLNTWGARFTELKMGKPHFDLFIDDKNINSEEYFK
tara:strand:- start:478 stop:801 length:324 start_codon:yes stop_codon:yes gene_type:complete